ncbi:MAG: hypothetical protein WC289_03110 [Patescibacteria group bacterium]
MMIPYWIILVAYGIGFAIFLLLASLSIYHVVRFARMSKSGLIGLYLFLACVIVVLGMTWLGIRDIDWTQEAELNLPFVVVQN